MDKTWHILIVEHHAAVRDKPRCASDSCRSKDETSDDTSPLAKSFKKPELETKYASGRLGCGREHGGTRNGREGTFWGAAVFETELERWRHNRKICCNSPNSVVTPHRFHRAITALRFPLDNAMRVGVQKHSHANLRHDRVFSANL